MTNQSSGPTLAGRPKVWSDAATSLKKGVKESPSYDLKRMINERCEAITLCAADLKAVLAVLRERVKEWREQANEYDWRVDLPLGLENKMLEFWERQLGMSPNQKGETR